MVYESYIVFDENAILYDIRGASVIRILIWGCMSPRVISLQTVIPLFVKLDLSEHK